MKRLDVCQMKNVQGGDWVDGLLCGVAIGGMVVDIGVIATSAGPIGMCAVALQGFLE